MRVLSLCLAAALSAWSPGARGESPLYADFRVQSLASALEAYEAGDVRRGLAICASLRRAYPGASAVEDCLVYGATRIPAANQRVFLQNTDLSVSRLAPFPR